MLLNRVMDLFTYDDGKLYWKCSRGCVKAGSQAGAADSNGRLRVKIDGKKYLVHRVVYLMHYGELPEFIDHIDNDYTNNCVENLRPASKSTNNWNQKLATHNKSGVKGVYRHGRSGKWVAQVYANNTIVLYKEFASIEEAETAAIEARRKHHGVYARHQ